MLNHNFSTRYSCSALVGVLAAMFFLPLADALAQTSLEQVVQSTEDGQIIEQGELVAPPRSAVRQIPVRTAVASSDEQTQAQLVRWGGRYYRPGYYYGPARPRYYAGYPGYYANPYYNNYGYYGYRGGYYGRAGYYPGYYGSPYGAARVGPLRFYW